MVADSFFASMSRAEWVLNFALHSLLVLFMGWFFIRLLKRKSAPLRSKISFVTMLALLLLPFFSVAYQSFDIAFYKTSLPFTGDSSLSHPGVNDVGNAAVMTEQDTPASLSDKSAANTKRPSKLSVFLQSILSGITTANVINGVGLVWFAGFVLLLARLLYGAASLHGFKKGLIKIKDTRLDRILRQAQETFRFRSLPEVYASKEAKSPVVLGIARPRVVLPQKVYRKLSSKEIRSILFHELSHIYHKDQVTGVLQRIVTALYWWNPFVHTLSTDFSKAREEISDNHAIIGNNSREYAECLVNLAEKTALVNRLPFLRGLAVRHIPMRERISQILSKERIMATETKKSTTLIILLVFVLSIGLITGYKWTFASDKIETKEEWTQETEAEIQEEKAIEQKKEQEQEKKKKEGEEKTLSAQEKEEIEKMLKELKIKLSEVHVDVAPEISVDLKRDFKVDAAGKVAVEVKPVLVVKVKPEFPEKPRKKIFMGKWLWRGQRIKKETS